jgi:hypothetical protein
MAKKHEEKTDEKHKTEPEKEPERHLTQLEFYALTFLGTLVLAGIAIVMRINEPVVWGFLGTAIGFAVGQGMQGNKNV